MEGHITADLVGSTSDGGELVRLNFFGTPPRHFANRKLVVLRGVSRNEKYENLSLGDAAEVCEWVPESKISFPASPLKIVWA